MASLHITVAPSGTVCSIVPFPAVRDSQTTAFIGRALADTLYAGPGDVRYTLFGGHWSSDRGDRQIYGQRIKVLRLEGAGADRLRNAFAARRDSSVVVVPWDYDASCQPTPWRRTAGFTTPETIGVFTVRLRSENHWADGLPTFDALQADVEPYPHGVFYQQGYRGTDAVKRGEGLSVSEFYEFYLALPSVSPFSSDSLQYRQIMCGWARAHPKQAGRFPASRLIGWARC
jgi:hypothetical protein